MKKLSQRRIDWMVQRAQRELGRTRARRQRMQMRSLSSVASERVVVYQHGRRRNAILEGQRKPVPARLSLNRTWDDTVQFLADVREGLNKGIDARQDGFRKPRSGGGRERWVRGTRLGDFWDFSQVEHITIPVALMLASQYDRSRQLSSWTPYAIDIDDWSPDVRGLLRAVGFLDLAGVEAARHDVVEAGARRTLRMRRGRSTDGEAVASYLAALGVDVYEFDPGLMDAIMEAVTNCVHHAYKDMKACEPRTLPEWWLLASVEPCPGGQWLRIIVYDHGATIPRTLPSWERFPVVRRQLAKLWESLSEADDVGAPDNARFDGDAIRIALDVGKSSTAEHNRGKGLDQIVRALDLCAEGSVAIHSRRGSFMRMKDAEGTRERSINRRVPIIGTMVFWKLMISAVTE